MTCYTLFFVREDWIGVAECNEPSAGFELLYQQRIISNWRPLLFSIKDGERVHYQPNDLGFALCSWTLRKGIEEILTGREAIQWLPVYIRNEERDAEEYFILHVYRRDEVLNMQRSIFSGNHLVKPVLDREKVYDLNANVFAKPFDYVRIYVRETVKLHLTHLRMTGIKFLKAAMV